MRRQPYVDAKNRWVDDTFLRQEPPPRLTPERGGEFPEREGCVINGMSN
jgi:hypothetical protein